MDLTVVAAVGEVPVWTRWQCGLSGVEEHAGKFDSMSASSPNPRVRVYGDCGGGFYRWTTVGMGMIMSSCPSLLVSTVATVMMTS
jgi:hypothetical protein